MRRPLRHPPVLAAALLLALLGTYMLIVPRGNWAGLLPSSSPISTSTSILPPLPNSKPPADLRDTLAALASNFTSEYARHSPSPPPEPVYAGPYLTAAQRKRYDHLRRPLSSASSPSSSQGHFAPKYMLTTITREITSQLPDLLNTIAVLAHFLGAEHLSLSILEGPSGDATPHILNNVLHPLLAHLGVPESAVRIETGAPAIEWGTVNRIEALAELRNKALEPLWLDVDVASSSQSTVGKDVAAVVFVNDVFLHAADVLELLHQHVASKAAITTAWDWMTRDPAYFYDVWVARTIDTGDLFYPIPGSEWHPSDNLFSDSPSSREAFGALRPFQAYSSWNALAVLAPEPFRPPFGVRFRRGASGECAASECLLVCADFWKAGFGRVQVVPAVQLAYGRDVALETARRLRQDTQKLGWNSGVPPKGEVALKWKSEPPRKLRCNPWPEVTGLSANVWEKTEWLPPWVRA